MFRVILDQKYLHCSPLYSSGLYPITHRDIGSAWCETPTRAVKTLADLLTALRAGQVDGHWTPPALALAYKMWNKAKEKLSP